MTAHGQAFGSVAEGTSSQQAADALHLNGNGLLDEEEGLLMAPALLMELAQA
ncbi:hypothetical protein ACWGFX_25245 [Streptomyces xanthophaeus]